MKLTTGILAVVMITGAAWAQNLDAINNPRSNAALAVAGVPAAAQAGKPAAGSPARPGSSTAARPAVVRPAAVPAARSNPAPATMAPKPHVAFVPRKAFAPPVAKVAAKPVAVPVAKPAVPATTKIAAAGEAPKPPKPEEKKWAMNGKRDPFFSPVVQQPTGSGCSTGKKCLEIGQINVRGVVKSESGFIAVVTNSLNKAYFLHENDPVFNGYVVRITGDSVVFQETVEDKLGKPSTREVVKRIFTPAV
jgi:Tfp pilus assembly protein PilP